MAGPQRTKYGDLVFDATLAATRSESSEITEYPVEDGANPADHIRAKALTVSLDVLFSPLAPVGELDSANARGWREAKRNAGGGDARAQLEKLCSMQGRTYTLVMPWATLADMAIASISTPVSAAVEGFVVKVDFKQLRFVASDSVRFKKNLPRKGAAKEKPDGKIEKGKASASAASPQEKSLLAAATDAVIP